MPAVPVLVIRRPRLSRGGARRTIVADGSAAGVGVRVVRPRCRRRITGGRANFDGLAEQPLDRFQERPLLARNERNREPLVAGTARAPNAVHVVLGDLG